MIAPQQGVSGREPIYHNSTDPSSTSPPDPDRPRENYFSHKFDEESFPDPNLMDIDDKSKEEAERKEIEAMIQRAIAKDIGPRFVKPLRDLVWEFRSTFSTRFSSTPSKVDPPHIHISLREIQDLCISLKSCQS